MKRLSLAVLLLFPNVFHALNEHSFRLFALAGYGTEQQQFYAKTSSQSSGSPFYGLGIGYALYMRRGVQKLLHTLDTTATVTFTPYGFMQLDIYAGYGVGFISKGGRLTFDVIGLGIYIHPLYNAHYEYAEASPPFRYEKGTLPKAVNVGVLINIPGLQWTGPEPYGFYIAWRNLINISVYNGGAEAAASTALAHGLIKVNYDNIRWDISFRTSLLIGFDFISITRKYKGTQLDRRLRVE